MILLYVLIISDTLDRFTYASMVFGCRTYKYKCTHALKGDGIMLSITSPSRLLRPQIAELSVVEKLSLFSFLFLYNCNLAECFCSKKSTRRHQGKGKLKHVGLTALGNVLGPKISVTCSSVMAGVLMHVFVCAQWHALSREEQAKYYELARKERQLHMQLYPGWSARDNYVSF